MLTLVYSLEPPHSTKGVKEWKYPDAVERLEDLAGLTVPAEVRDWVAENCPEYRELTRDMPLADQWLLGLRVYDPAGYRVNRDGTHGPERRDDL